MHGKTVNLPAGFYGLVAEKGETKAVIPEADGLQGDADAEELPDAVEIAPLRSKAKFDDFVIWGHESTADSGDPYLRSIEEWVSFSEQVCTLGNHMQTAESSYSRIYSCTHIHRWMLDQSSRRNSQ